MKTQLKIEKAGYKVTANMGYRNGEQTIVSYTASKNGCSITRPNITQLFKSL